MQPRIRHRDASLAGDAGLVLDASAALGVREFDLFRLAYRRWYGREVDEKRLERYFAPCMFHQVTPPWVRHLCRVQHPVPLGWLYVALTVIVALLAHVLILSAYSHGPEPGPEDVGPGLRFILALFDGGAG